MGVHEKQYEANNLNLLLRDTTYNRMSTVECMNIEHVLHKYADIFPVNIGSDLPVKFTPMMIKLEKMQNF